MGPLLYILLMKRRKILFALISMTVVPLLLFVGMEMGLRLGGYGYSTNYFVKANKGNTYRSNQKFGWRFFSPHLARFPLPLSLSKDKSSGTYRIFVLGGSAARGEPDYSFSFSRILGKMLSNNYPNKEFEIINTAMVAINSHVVYQIAKECVKLKPDLLIVYLGNNEVIGPFGSGTVFGSYSPNLTMIRAGIWANSLRLGQLFSSLIQNIFAKKQNIRVWRGMEMFLEHLVPFDDQRLHKVYAHFEKNLTDIIKIGGNSGAKVVISTVATNLKDNAPFASVHRQDLSEVQKINWEKNFQAGGELAAEGKFEEAVNRYLRAVQIDDNYAELHFLLARCYSKLKNYKEARKYYIKARDLDALRFRADTQINRIIRDKASQREDEGVYLVDAVHSFEESERTSHKIPGEELFYEHVHMNFFGNYLLAKSVFSQVSSILSEDMRLSNSREIPILSPERCADLLAFTKWDLSRILTRILERVTRPPFTNQANNEQGQKKIIERMKRVKTHLMPADLDLVQQAFQRALENNPDDWILHDNFAEFFKERGNFEEAITLWRTALKSVPDYADMNNNLGVLLAYKGKLYEAINFFSEALRINPYLREAHSNLGVLLKKIGKMDEANKHFAKAERLKPNLR